MTLFLKIWIWITFLRNKETLPTELNTLNPKVEYEWLSGAFIWEDEGLWELRNFHLMEAFKYVIKHRMVLITGPDSDDGEFMRSKKFDKRIFEMAEKRFPDWIGFDKSRCSYNADLAKRLRRIKKVEDWRIEKLMNE